MKQKGKYPRNVANALVIKDRDLFFIAARDGGVPAGNLDGFGIYFHDCRYLNSYQIRLDGTALNSLLSTAEHGSIARFEMTNETLKVDGNEVPAQSLGCALFRKLDGAELTVMDQVTIRNHSADPFEGRLVFQFDSEFEDIFEIRGLKPKKIGRERPAKWTENELTFQYDGADDVERQLLVCFQPSPTEKNSKCAVFAVHLAPAENVIISLTLRLQEHKRDASKVTMPPSPIHQGLGFNSRLKSDWEPLNKLTGRSLQDLRILVSELDQLRYFAAGLPWYGALFGRDSIIAALQLLPLEPDIAASTLRLLAKYQATEVNDYTDAEPGKILHELRRGELANLAEIPQTPYYGSVDSTPLFLLLLGELARWTGDLRLFKELEPNINHALRWIDDKMSEYGGYLAYQSKSSNGLGNQGWKDSGDAIVNQDGSLAEPPIALPEVQGYVYRAKLLLAELFGRTGDDAKAARLRSEANSLKARFNRDFWISSKGFYALALQKDGRCAEVITSNPGQALWTGIIDASRVDAVVHTLMSPEMFSGWGVRTLSTSATRYNPVGYHLGTVWPHDSSMIAAGLKTQGKHQEALSIFTGLVRAAQCFEDFRLPEVFAGFGREQYAEPVRYPVACHPQAWAAGSVPFLLMACLGLEPDAFNHRLIVEHPQMPASVDLLDLNGIRVGSAVVDLRFTRSPDGAQVEVTRSRGEVSVELTAL